MKKQFQSTVYLFRKINPAKKYSSFGFHEIENLKDFVLYTEKDKIVRYYGEYYQYKGTKERLSITQQKSVIRIMDGKELKTEFYKN